MQINATSLELTCGLLFDSRFGEEEEIMKANQTFIPLKYDALDVDEIGAYCALGGKRSQESKCNSTQV